MYEKKSYEKCANCKYYYKLKKYDYSGKGCKHSDMDGHICMAFADERTAIWMYGTSDDGICECFEQR